MTKLEGKEAAEYLRAGIERDKKVRAERLAKARADAATRGKEPFDLDKLEKLCDTSSEGRVDPRDIRQDRFEHMYYVEQPQILTLAELAQHIEEISKW